MDFIHMCATYFLETRKIEDDRGRSRKKIEALRRQCKF